MLYIFFFLFLIIYIYIFFFGYYFVGLNKERIGRWELVSLGKEKEKNKEKGLVILKEFVEE